MINVLIVGILGLIIGMAAGYVYKSRKRGAACIGCPHSGQCGGGCSGCTHK